MCESRVEVPYKYIIYSLRNKQFSIVTKEGVTRQMPSFENMESFGYTLLQTPIESLIISYPSQELKNVLDELKEEPLSKEFSPSFSELSEKMDETNDTSEDSPGYVEEEQEKRKVKTNMSERKDTDDDVYDSEPKNEINTQMKPKKKRLFVNEKTTNTEK